MTVYNIRRVGAPVLQAKATQVTTFDSRLKSLARNLWDTLLEADGLGLAAPQIGRGVRVAVIQAGGFREVLVNPTMLGHGPRDACDEEGCLSIPGVRRRVCRFATIELFWNDLDGHGHTQVLRGIAARCAQHELDHLTGRLIIDHV